MGNFLRRFYAVRNTRAIYSYFLYYGKFCGSGILIFNKLILRTLVYAKQINSSAEYSNSNGLQTIDYGGDSSTSSRFSHRTGVWVNTRADIDGLEKRKYLLLLLGQSSLQPRRNTDCTLSVLPHKQKVCLPVSMQKGTKTRSYQLRIFFYKNDDF